MSLNARGQFNAKDFSGNDALDKDFCPEIQKLLNLLKFREFDESEDEKSGKNYLIAILSNSRKRALNRKVCLIGAMLQTLEFFLKESKNEQNAQNSAVSEKLINLGMNFVNIIFARGF